MEILIVNITDSRYSYGKLLLDRNQVEENYGKISEVLRSQPISKYRCIGLDCAFVGYLIKELKISQYYRSSFIKKWCTNERNRLALVLRPTNYDLIDYEWNHRVFLMVREKCELEHALSWLSTLGGAFSALGDYFPNFADTAGKISVQQLRLALRLGDPNIATRCRLYISLSLIQKKKFALARKMIEREYNWAKKAPVVDKRLLNMCQGIWAKLQYEYAVFRKYRRKSNDIRKRFREIKI